jgi:hypothetical protein
MSTSPMGANKSIEDIEATLLAGTKSALDGLVWQPRATMAARPLKLHNDGPRMPSDFVRIETSFPATRVTITYGARGMPVPLTLTTVNGQQKSLRSEGDRI